RPAKTLHPLGANLAHRSWLALVDQPSHALVDGSRCGFACFSVRRMALHELQPHPAHRASRQRLGLPAMLPYVRTQPVRKISLLAHELPYRASHVCRCALLSPWEAASFDPCRSAAHTKKHCSNLEAD